MGYKTEINYILKSSTDQESTELHENLQVGSTVTITKSGHRTFVLNSPIMIADKDWKIVGMCAITESTVNSSKTILKATILTVFNDNESQVISKAIQDGEKSADQLIRK